MTPPTIKEAIRNLVASLGINPDLAEGLRSVLVDEAITAIYLYRADAAENAAEVAREAERGWEVSTAWADEVTAADTALRPYGY